MDDAKPVACTGRPWWTVSDLMPATDQKAVGGIALAARAAAKPADAGRRPWDSADQAETGTSAGECLRTPVDERLMVS